jgi:hypothetical protein
VRICGGRPLFSLENTHEQNGEERRRGNTAWSFNQKLIAKRQNLAGARFESSEQKSQAKMREGQKKAGWNRHLLRRAQNGENSWVVGKAKLSAARETRIREDAPSPRRTTEERKVGDCRKTWSGKMEPSEQESGDRITTRYRSMNTNAWIGAEDKQELKITGQQLRRTTGKRWDRQNKRTETERPNSDWLQHTGETKKNSFSMEEHDEDIIGSCGVRFDPEAHIPPVEYG